MLRLYRAATALSAPLVRLHLRRRQAQGREDFVRLGERLGFPGRQRPPGPLVWIHAASVGEAVSALALVGRLRTAWDVAVLVTTGTRTAAAVMADRLAPGSLHQYVPVDLPSAVERFLAHWRPDLAIWIESELWPNLVLATAGRGIPCVLLNARMSARSHRRWSLWPGAARRLLASFRLCLARTPEDARRFATLGAGPVRCVGDLKQAAAPLPAEPTALARLRSAIGSRPVWLAASTHAPEEALAGRIHAALRRSHPDLLTLLVPRHPERGAAIAAELKATGLRVVRRSGGEMPGPATDIFLGDTVGELGLFYRLAPIAFIGRSLLAAGGQNPLEAARLGCAVLYGPAMHNFADLAAEMAEAGAALVVPDEAALTAALHDLLHDSDRRRGIAAAAGRFAERRNDVLDAVMAELAPFRPEPAQLAPSRPRPADAGT